MSVLQNINGSLYRMDASDLVQLAAVDTEGILGGTPGATTNGQALVDQLAADDVQAQTDIGQIRTDLSDYHVIPSRNLCPFYTNVVGGFTYTPDENGYTSCSSASDTRSWSYSVSNILFRLPAGSYHFHVFAKTAYTSGYTGARLYDSSNNLIGGLANFDGDMGFDFTLAATTDLGLIYKLGNGSYAFMVSTAANWSVNNTYEPYYATYKDFSAVKDGAISYENGIGQQYATDVPLKKQGNVCMLSISLVGIVLSQGTWGSIGTLPSGFRPYKNAGGINVVKNAAGDVFDCEAQAGGILRIRDNTGSVASTDIVHFNGAYYAP